AERVSRLTALTAAYNAATATATATDTRNYHLARLREVFGQEFRVLPRFTPSNAATLGAAFAASTTLQNNNRLEAVTWLQRAAGVRAGASRLDASLAYADALGGTGANLIVGQLPFGGTSDRWVGLPAPPTGMLAGRVSIVTHAPAPIDTTRPLAGLLVDEW